MTIGAPYSGTNPLKLTWDNPETTSFLDQTVLKTHLAVDGSALDFAIEIYEQAAILWAEDYMRRSIMAREHRWVLSDFPRGHHRTSSHSMRSMQLPRGKTIRVNYIQYCRGGQYLNLFGPSASGSPPSTSDFQEDLAGDGGGTIMPLRNRDWPSVDYDSVNPVVVSFRAGWETPSEVPAAIKHAVMFAIDDMLEVRGVKDIADLQQLAAVGKTVEFRESLLGYHRLIRIY